MLVVKNPPANAGDERDGSSILGLGRSPGGQHGDPFQFSCLERPQTEEPDSTGHRVMTKATARKHLEVIPDSLVLFLCCFI